MRLLVCGGRDFADGPRLDAALAAWTAGAEDVLVMEGGSGGADQLAHDWAIAHGIACRTFTPDPAKGPSARLVRNQEMIDVGQPDLVLAFPGGAGTADVVRRAQAAGIRVVFG